MAEKESIEFGSKFILYFLVFLVIVLVILSIAIFSGILKGMPYITSVFTVILAILGWKG
jgi:hypothetical protein